MGRKNRRANAPLRQLPKDGAAYYGTQAVSGPRWAQDEVFLMRRIGAHAATKYYICPGCNQNILPGIAHVVAWPKDLGRGVEDRRHWHTACWERR